MADLPESLAALIRSGREERNLEFKEQLDWDNKLQKEKFARTILGMSNLRDGGAIIVGVAKDGTPVGMPEEEALRLNHDLLAPFVNEYAEPYVRFTVTPGTLPEDSQKWFVVVTVEEFDEYPVICKKDGQVLKRGALYTRGRNKHETRGVRSVPEMKEMIEMAVEKGIRLLLARAGRAGLLSGRPTDAQLFESQLGGL
ncbi:MAG TPA: ATP-binding protein [Dehalococcoidia bacterium]|nr:ATP-binding protein [Dehalococcoidia bacterium]